MKFFIYIFLLFFIWSCKKEIKKTEKDDSIAIKVDTTYCDYNKIPIIDTVKTSMNNESYKCLIATSSLLNKSIVFQDSNQVTICYDKEAKIILLQEQDTVFNVTINMDVLNKEYNTFYKEHQENLKNSEDGFSKFNIPKPTQSLILDSLVHSGARSSHIYFTCYNTDYKTAKRYKSHIGVNYLNKKDESMLTSQLIELNQ